MAGIFGNLLPGSVFQKDTDTEISDKSVNLLLDSTGVRIPDEEKIRSKLIAYIKENWKNREGMKSVATLVEENKSPCVKYFFDQLIGDETLPINIFHIIRYSRDGGASDEDIDLLIKDRIINIGGIFINGFFKQFEENFQFDKSGKPIGVRTTMGDPDRFGEACVRSFVAKTSPSPVPLPAPTGPSALQRLTDKIGQVPGAISSVAGPAVQRVTSAITSKFATPAMTREQAMELINASELDPVDLQFKDMLVDYIIKHYTELPPQERKPYMKLLSLAMSPCSRFHANVPRSLQEFKNALEIQDKKTKDVLIESRIRSLAMLLSEGFSVVFKEQYEVLPDGSAIGLVQDRGQPKECKRDLEVNASFERLKTKTSAQIQGTTNTLHDPAFVGKGKKRRTYRKKKVQKKRKTLRRIRHKIH